MTKETTFCDRCGKEISKKQKPAFQIALAPYCDDFGNVISEGRPIDLCEACYSDLENFMNSFKSGTSANPDLPLPDKVGEEIDDKDKLKLIEKKLDQLEKDIHRLEISYATIEVKRTYPWAMPDSVAVYAAPSIDPYGNSLTSKKWVISTKGGTTDGNLT